MKHWKLGFIALSVSAAFSVQVTYAANPISQQQVNDLFCNSNLPIPSNLCPTSSPTARNPASQQYVCERYVAVKESSVPVKIGDCVGGGIVYYIDNTQKRGLIVALTDVTGIYPWGSSINPVTSSDLFTGQANTVAMGNLGSLAALAALNATPTPACPASMQSCSPWYLPSQNELMAVWNVALTVINTSTCPGAVDFLGSLFYWSSTQFVPAQAWVVVPTTGSVNPVPKSQSYKVRPVRTFYY